MELNNPMDGVFRMRQTSRIKMTMKGEYSCEEGEVTRFPKRKKNLPAK